MVRQLTCCIKNFLGKEFVIIIKDKYKKHLTDRSSRLEMFFQIRVLKHFTIFPVAYSQSFNVRVY